MEQQAQSADNFLARAWGWMGRHPLFVLAVLMVAQTALTFWRGELWYPDEVRHASALRNMLHSGNYLYLELAGQPYADKPPLYFWLQAALVKLLGTDAPPVFFIAVAISGLLFLYSTYALARCVAGLDRPSALLGALILPTTYFFLERCHSPRMDLLFFALINFSLVCLFLGWSRPGWSAWVMAGGFFAVLATLTKGPLALAVPVLAGVAWLGWQKNLRRLWSLDVAAAAGVAVVILGGWVWACYRAGGRPLMDAIFIDQLFHRAVRAPDNLKAGKPFYFYIVTLAEMWLPWTLLVFFLPWRRLLNRKAWLEGRGVRGQMETGGPAFLWCTLLSEMLLLSSLHYKLTVYVLLFFGPLAVLTGRHLERLAPASLRRLAVTLAVIFSLMALGAPWVKFLYPWPHLMKGLGWAGGLLGLLAFALFRCKTRLAGQLVLVVAAGMMLAVQPMFLITRPGLDVIMSPKGICAELRRHIERGLVPVTFGISHHHYCAGSLHYYVGHEVPDMKTENDFLRHLAEHPRLVLLTSGWFWDHWTNRPASLQMVHIQPVEWHNWVIAVQDGPAGPPQE